MCLSFSEVGLGSQCPEDDACGTADAVCRTGCVCKYGFYDTNGLAVNGTCESGMVI